MNYRGKDKLAEALKKGLLETARPKKDDPVISENLAARLAAYQEPSNETVKDISGVASALTPKRQPWEIVEEKKPVAPVIVESKAPQKTLKEIASTVRLNKVEEKPLIINESTDSIAGVLTNQGKRLWRPARKESLEEKVERLESELSLFEEGSHEYLKKIHAGATNKRRDGWSEHVISHGGKKYRLVTNGVRAAMENYRGHVVPHKKVASIVSKLAESVEQLDEFKKGEDIGKPGLNFKKVAAKAAKEYGSKAAGKRVAGAVLQKILHKEEVEHLNEETEPKHKFNKVLAKHGYVYKGSHTEKSLGGRDHDFPSHNYEHPKTGGKVHVWQQKGAADTYHSRHKQTNGILAPGHGDTKGQLDRHLERWNKYNDGWERGGLRESLNEDVSRNRHNVHLEYDNAKGERKKQIIEINGKADHVAAAKAAREHYQAVDKGRNFHVKKVYTVGLDKDANLQFGEPVTDGVNEKPKSTIWKGLKKHLGMKEEVEQIDELNASTLGRYIRKSQKETHSIEPDLNKSRQVDRDWGIPSDKTARLERKFKNRNNGMDAAERALNKKDRLKEERLDELSADTLTKYGDRAWRSKANAHIDRGGADYLDDDKARKNATKTIGKRERGLALARAMMKKKEC
jgi:hypothetical protein